MISLVRGGGGLRPGVFALALGIWVISQSSAPAFGDGLGLLRGAPSGPAGFGHGNDGYGTTSYGGPGLSPGFYGFGLGFHPGYGYGGRGLGTGNGGGFPYYAGPGYPQPDPPLDRFGHIVPYLYNGTPCNGFSGYQPAGPLVVDQSVVTVGNGREFGYTGDFGPATGMIPYPEAYFAPFTTAAATTGSSTGVPPSNSPASPPPGGGFGSPSSSLSPGDGGAGRGRGLDIGEEPVVDADGVRGLKVTGISPGTAAERAGLRAGDVIRSINGYRTERPANLDWIVAHASSDHVLTMKVRNVDDGRTRQVTLRLR
jgi:PDZ domain